MITRQPEFEDPFALPFPFFALADEDDELWQQLSAAEGYTELGMFAEAHRELNLVDQHEEFRLEVAIRKLDLFLAEKRWKDAAIYGEILTEFDEEEPAHFMKYATALHELGRADTAIYVLSLAPSKLERDPEFHWRLAGYELEAGTSEEALFHLENAIALDPELRHTARHDPQLKALVNEVPEAPRFIPSQPEYEPEPGERDNRDDGAGDGEVAASEFDPFDPFDPTADTDFECPF